MTPEILLAVQNVGLGIASFVFLAVIIWYILRRDDKRFDNQVKREDERIAREDKRYDSQVTLINTQSQQVATLIQSIGNLSAQAGNMQSVLIEIMKHDASQDGSLKQMAVELIQIRSMLGDRRKPDTGELSRIMEKNT